jgi:hypothetical protein
MNDQPIPVNLGPRLEQLPPVRHVFRAASGSRPGMFHICILFYDDKVVCTCEGWRMNRKCWHTTQVMEEYELDPDFSVSLD